MAAGGAWDGGPELPRGVRLAFRLVAAVVLAFALVWLVIGVLFVVANTRDTSGDEDGRRCVRCEPLD